MTESREEVAEVSEAVSEESASDDDFPERVEAESAQESESDEEEGFTDEELAGMSEAEKRISDALGTEEYKKASLDKKKEIALSVLNELADEGLVKKESIFVYGGGNKISFQYSCGVLGGVMLTPFDPMMN